MTTPGIGSESADEAQSLRDNARTDDALAELGEFDGAEHGPATDDDEWDAADAADLAERTNEVAQATSSVFRNALIGMLILVGVVSVLGSVVGFIVDGTAGVWGALLGAALTLVFSGTTVVSMLKTAQSSAQTMAMVVLGGWVGKMIVLVAALAVLGNYEFYNKYVFAAVLLVGVMGSVALDYRAVAKGRVPYVSPGTKAGK